MSPQYKQYQRFMVKLIGDKNFFEVDLEAKNKIVEALVKGAKYINMGNIFFASSALSSILPVSDVTGEIPYMPNKELSDGKKIENQK
jgi:hypothetical protein